MTKIHINIGSNIDKKNQIKLALTNLAKHFDNLVLSSIYETEPVGFKGDNFYNLGVDAITNLNITAIHNILHGVEISQGRNKNLLNTLSRTIDLDLVLYGQEINKKYNIPRDDILKYSFVLAPLAELMPSAIHPEVKITYNKLWQKLHSNTKINKYNISLLKVKV